MFIQNEMTYLCPEDLCSKCKHSGFPDGKMCPMLGMLSLGFMDLTVEAVIMKSCDFYEVKERHLRLVKSDNGGGNDRDTNPTPREQPQEI